MSAPAAPESGKSLRPDVSLISEVTPEEIAQRSGGVLRDRRLVIDYPNFNAQILVGNGMRQRGDLAPTLRLVLPDGEEESGVIEFSLEDMGVVFGEGEVIFVRRPKPSLHAESEETVFGITVSKGKGIMVFVKPITELVDQVRQAAELVDEAFKRKSAPRWVYTPGL